MKTVCRGGLSHHLKTIRLFLSATVAEKTAAEKPKKKSKSWLPPNGFFVISTELQYLNDCGFR
jgi:hypothetical protein